MKAATAAALCAVILLSGAADAMAQSPTRLSDTRVRAYYKDLTTLFKKDFEDFAADYTGRLHPDLVYTTRTTVTLPGQPPIETDAIVLKRDDLAANTRPAYDAAQGAKLANDVGTITFSPDGKRAFVKNVSTITGMNFPTSDGSVMKANSVETCDDELILNAGITQIIKASCTTSVTILPQATTSRKEQ